MLAALLDDLGVAVGDRGRFDCVDPLAVIGGVFGSRGRRGDGQEEEQEGDAQGEDAAPPHRPKCSSTTGATSRSAHCSRSSAAAGPQPTKSSGPSESPACSEPWLPPPAWVTPPQSTAS